ncbi:hypothetical protein E3E35_05560 [Thermococcus sp. GR7]|uniref:hypothetical protein n=1 Tax=unclassified Thermococcus TaxID=2627626 RepID=UPI0014318EA2|nr:MULTISPECIES: hypothetical protein [unclassified Thermococcus]NJE46886.1 hypothetical protein [Thermococcus sp. GR7]NJE78383.1 hypothetical protein [Thermococcus sp. GR4]NJF23320.1 hypothetical protein [Thermococcus sp. GR5]
MKKLSILLLVVFLVGIGAGCIWENTGTSTTPAATSNTSSPKVVLQPKHYPTEELLKNMRSIKQFTYLENTSMILHVRISQGNVTRDEGNVTVIYKRKGYIDLDSKEADVNTTTRTFPGGAAVFSRQIIKDDEIYVFSSGTWQKMTNETLGIDPETILNLTWEYNIVSFVAKYLQEEPSNTTIENDTQLLYYQITKEDLDAMTKLFIGSNANMTFNVTNGILEVRFRDGVLVGGRIAYQMEIRIWGKDIYGQEFEVYEKGHVYDEFVVRDINVKKPVKKPVSYRA